MTGGVFVARPTHALKVDRWRQKPGQQTMHRQEHLQSAPACTQEPIAPAARFDGEISVPVGMEYHHFIRRRSLADQQDTPVDQESMRCRPEIECVIENIPIALVTEAFAMKVEVLSKPVLLLFGNEWKVPPARWLPYCRC